MVNLLVGLVAGVALAPILAAFAFFNAMFLQVEEVKTEVVEVVQEAKEFFAPTNKGTNVANLEKVEIDWVKAFKGDYKVQEVFTKKNVDEYVLGLDVESQEFFNGLNANEQSDQLFIHYNKEILDVRTALLLQSLKEKGLNTKELRFFANGGTSYEEFVINVAEDIYIHHLTLEEKEKISRKKFVSSFVMFLKSKKNSDYAKDFSKKLNEQIQLSKGFNEADL